MSPPNMAPTPPPAIVLIGMAGSGKTTFMQQLSHYLHSKHPKTPPYVINLDPAVRHVPFEPNIDIRDSIDYKEVMKQYNLGPNGGILTSLNLFATKVDQVLGLLEKRCGLASTTTSEKPASSTSSSKPTTKSPVAPVSSPSHILLDTPGQIEVFVWSASGQILLSSLASTFPTILAYIIDTPRTASTATFMANMLYACSILYKTRLPMVLVFNKSDVKDPAFAKEWMTDFETFQAALRREEEEGVAGGGGDGAYGVAGGGGAGGGSGYMNSLLSSMSLVLEEFYAHLKVVGVSSVTGQGMGEFLEAVAEKAEEFEKDYKPELQRRMEEVAKNKTKRREEEMGRLMHDLNVQGRPNRKVGSATGRKPKKEPETISDLEDEDDEEESGLVERDDDEEEDENDDAITQRYRQATRHDEEARQGDDELMSFERYIRKSQTGKG